MGEDKVKNKKVRLKGKALSKLNDDIHERDGHTCIIAGCGRFVLPGEKFHHEPCGPDKEDRIECGVLLCFDHHYERHSGKNSRQVRRECEAYLNALYGGDT